MDNLINKELTNFKPTKSKPVVTKKIQNYFIKLVGSDRFESAVNEVEILEKLKKKISFYKYFIKSIIKGKKIAILLQYIPLKTFDSILKCELNIQNLLSLYKCLLTKIKMFHDNCYTHGDVKPENIIIYIKNKNLEIEFIDVESMTDFSEKDKEKLIKNITHNDCINTALYVPYYKESAYGLLSPQLLQSSFRYLTYKDIYGISLIILYIYNKKLYEKLCANKYKRSMGVSNKFVNLIKEGEISYPSDFVKDQKNKLERILYYVFSKIDRQNLSEYELEKDSSILCNVNDILKKYNL